MEVMTKKEFIQIMAFKKSKKSTQILHGNTFIFVKFVHKKSSKVKITTVVLEHIVPHFWVCFSEAIKITSEI